MMKLYHIPIKLSIALFSHQPIMGMQFYPTTVSYWLGSRESRKVLLKRVRKPLMTLKNGQDGWVILAQQLHVEVVKCYKCYSITGNMYYSLSTGIIITMSNRKFKRTSGRIYPACQAKKESTVPQLVPQSTWWD